MGDERGYAKTLWGGSIACESIGAICWAKRLGIVDVRADAETRDTWRFHRLRDFGTICWA